jgi:threonine dehydratase
MLAILRLLFPSLLSIVGGVGLVAATVAGMSVYNRFIENPQIIAVERARITALVEAAAANARRIEQERQIKIADAAMEQAARTQEALEAAHAESISKLTEEAKRYAAQRLGEGRACPLDSRDIDFLNGLFLRGSLE